MFCTPVELEKIYNDFAPHYDRHIAWLEYIAGLRKLRCKMCAGVTGDVLDVATGTGANFEFFPSESIITGIDLSPEMLKLATNKTMGWGKKVELHAMDAERLSFANESFDTVVSALSLCTIPNPVIAIREMSRVCRSGGKILFLEHGPSSFRPLAFLQRVFVGDWHVRKLGCHWDRDPQELVRKAGLLTFSHRRYFFGMLHLIAVTKK